MTIFELRPWSAWRTTLRIARESASTNRPSYERMYLLAAQFRALARFYERENKSLREQLRGIDQN